MDVANIAQDGPNMRQDVSNMMAQGGNISEYVSSGGQAHQELFLDANECAFRACMPPTCKHIHSHAQRHKPSSPSLRPLRPSVFHDAGRPFKLCEENNKLEHNNDHGEYRGR